MFVRNSCSWLFKQQSPSYKDLEGLKGIPSSNEQLTSHSMMNLKGFLSLQVATEITQIAEVAAVTLGLTVSMAIVNEAGTLIYFKKMDESTNASVDIAIAKAKHAAYYRRDTKFHEDLLRGGNNLVLSLPNSMPVEGGVQLIYQNRIIGAIGVSGASSADDGLIAKAGADFLLTVE